MIARNAQRGVALIVVLMLLAIMTTIAASMTERLYTHFKRAGSQLNHQQAYWYSVGVEALAKAGLERAYKDSDTINLSQTWAIEEQTYPLDYGQARGHVRDMQSCFNLNALSSVAATTNSQRPYLVKVLQSLLEQQEVDAYQAEVVADSVWEYVSSSDTNLSISGVGSATYESLQPAYMAPNGLMADGSELRAIYQVEAPMVAKLNPLLCALPTSEWKLNVNTLKEPQAKLLVAMFQPYLSEQNATELIKNRSYDGWDSIDKFMQEASISSIDSKTKSQAQSFLSVDSHYFELDAEILVEQSRLRVQSLLYSKDKNKVDVVRRRFGGIRERVSDSQTQ
ncbi:type II secretion system minor pseudopilin GspK [Vibrio sp. SCSIO 43136]|uniref:type II secretion system minor pseudopilin GspK n=1 Tax=Vibrio sp. SCSIO 43136 TaxID=2819101 RepID=UPI0020754EEC|nr:type II secretion system minor pseudopilin GspK [Vibrio sp. SCSIO 43136]USD65182.1 type II secretion system minor pseudopilin GspK [Vibrio sp. SCSIO 43136]